MTFYNRRNPRFKTLGRLSFCDAKGIWPRPINRLRFENLTALATMEADPTKACNHDDATGFIRLNGLRLKVAASMAFEGEPVDFEWLKTLHHRRTPRAS